MRAYIMQLRHYGMGTPNTLSMGGRSIGFLRPMVKRIRYLYRRLISRCTGRYQPGSRRPTIKRKGLGVDRVIKPKGTKYETSDQNLIMVLLMSNYKYETRISPDKQLVYIFDLETVWPTIEAILTNNADEMMFNYTSFWRATVTWQMNLRHLSSVRGKV